MSNKEIEALLSRIWISVIENESGSLSRPDYKSWKEKIGVLIALSDVKLIIEYLGKLYYPGFKETEDLNNALFSISMELQKAKEAHPETDDFDVNKMALVVSEEAGEVCKAVLQYQDEDGSKNDIKAELIQTAAMCLRMLLNLNKY